VTNPTAHRIRIAWLVPSTLTAFLFLTLCAASAAAQDRPGEVNGRVVSSRDDQPLALVQVGLVGTAFSAITASDGTFQIAAVPPGSYVLQATTVGYRMIRQNFSLAAGDVKRFEVVLTSSTTTLTDSTEVVGDVFAVPESSAAAFTLEGDERKNLASVLADDPLRAVQSLPGVTSNDDFSSEFSVRGAPFSRVGLYLDGVLLHSPVHTTDGQADDGSLTIFNGDLTDDMTLYQGAWPVRYAGRTAGILAVDTRQGTREEVRTQFTASASNAGLVVEGPWSGSKRGAWLLAVRKSYLQYILNRIDFGDTAPLAFGFTDGQARLDYDLTSHHALSLSYVDGSSQVDRSRYRSELGPNTVMTSSFHSTVLNAGSRYATGRLLVSSHLAWSREKGSVGNRDRVAIADQSYTDATARSDATFMWSKRNTLDLGGELTHIRQESLATQLVYAPDLTETPDRLSGAAYQGGGYVQESLKYSRTSLAAGVRRDAHTASPNQVTTPYASISFEARPKTRLELDWGEYAQFPELSQSLSRFAPVPLQPERAMHFDAAMEQRLNDRTRLRLEIYDRQDRDLIARPDFLPRAQPDGTIVGASPGAPYLNSQHGSSRGVQVLVQRRTANGFTGWASYAYAHATLRDDVLHLSFPSDYDQRHTVNAYLSRRLRPTLNLSAHFAYGSGMPLPGFYRIEQGQFVLARNLNGVRAPVYERTDIRLNKDYVHQKVNATVYAEVINVTNHTNRDFDSAGPYDPATGATSPNFYSMFPVLPSVGIVFAF
jgi:Carboxypeptidase regulatory-like domain/TonB-dependent Receptor Plug Domain